MAKRTFLTDSDLSEAKKILIPPLVPPDGRLHAEPYFNCQSFAQWLSLRLELKLRESPHWAKAHPVATGSWARQELCPQSDFDLVFCGEEDDVRGLVDELYEMGLSVRYRVPEDPKDWTKGVEPFDCLALLEARPFTPEAASRLRQQQELLGKRLPTLRTQILSEIAGDRKARVLRHDSMTNFLEPNIKHGPGGLRDIFQGAQVYRLFREKFKDDGDHAVMVFSYYRAFFLTVRQWMHLNGHGDLLMASAQSELATWFGYDDAQEFMRQVQRGLSRASFYSDWIIEQASTPMKKIMALQDVHFGGRSAPLTHLQRDPSLLMQHKVRRSLKTLYSDLKKEKNQAHVGKLIAKVIAAGQKEKVTEAVFRANLIHPWVPELNRLRGLVQHDQYHRYTAEAHVFRAVREVQRVKAHPSKLGGLKEIVKRFTVFDWKVLSWTALYHDLGKGMKGQDHSEYGEALVLADAKKFKLGASLTKEVAWMVRNHLLISHAAFRTDPHSPTTWEHLEQHGVQGKRLHRLAVFTAIDILATNADAWNTWKSRLLTDLVRVMDAPETSTYLKTQSAVTRAGIQIDPEFLRSLDTSIFLALPTPVIKRDLTRLDQECGQDLPLLVTKDRNGNIWIRFHKALDQLGLFESFVAQIFAAGCKIRIAAVHTDKKYGAYDWFQVQTQKSVEPLRKLMEYQLDQEIGSIKRPDVFYHEVKLVSENEDCYVVSFRGPDQKGLLLNAAGALREVGAQVQWARVHTWGRQIDDIFGVQCSMGAKELIDRLRLKVRISAPLK